jgi:hypothetical protein
MRLRMLKEAPHDRSAGSRMRLRMTDARCQRISHAALHGRSQVPEAPIAHAAPHAHPYRGTDSADRCQVLAVLRMLTYADV